MNWQRCGLLALLCVSTWLVGCGDQTRESLDAFEKRWHQAINTRATEGLFDLLDHASRRQIEQQLEQMRGFPADEQRKIIDQLGGERLENLRQLTAAQYFGRLWHQTLAGARPTMRVEAEGSQTAYMIVQIDAKRQERFRLVLEAGRWAWQLPKGTMGSSVAGMAEEKKNPDAAPASTPETAAAAAPRVTSEVTPGAGK